MAISMHTITDLLATIHHVYSGSQVHSDSSQSLDLFRNTNKYARFAFLD